MTDLLRRWNDRTHIYAVAARTMRRVPVDYARAQNRLKRVGGAIRTWLYLELRGERLGG